MTEDEALPTNLSTYIHAYIHIYTAAALYLNTTVDKKHWVNAFVPCSRYGRVANSTGECANYFVQFLRDCNPSEGMEMFIRATSEKMVERNLKYSNRAEEQSKALSSGFMGFTNRATSRLQAQQKVSAYYSYECPSWVRK